MSLEDVARLPRRLPGTHFTCFTGTKVQILMQKALLGTKPCRGDGGCGGAYAAGAWHCLFALLQGLVVV